MLIFTKTSGYKRKHLSLRIVKGINLYLHNSNKKMFELIICSVCIIRAYILDSIVPQSPNICFIFFVFTKKWVDSKAWKLVMLFLKIKKTK